MHNGYPQPTDHVASAGKVTRDGPIILIVY